ncbi:uncharacterized protein PITG_06511 [Phytophthora infestans T30-4]|uniref:Uncharacterized protein n=1 Tax=Phytophthora infestans (strain T30-4) TaxID=403677 RepID=D0N508_PHYIT|nr:uncharacterized protein PITG_06511 [Phytophthora infestans T30-4]EEY69966.1 conserved hypothetical protein [Phytophthora infestans T30-4]|eukprot:XP_002998613.1 conserved hypothetical protein [Phytophthora infestans T30-4]
MAASERRPVRMDVKSMYPNFHAEQHKHHVQEKSTMAVLRKQREDSGGSARRDVYSAKTRPPSRNGSLQQKPRVHDSDELSRRAIPPIVPKLSSNQQEVAPPDEFDSIFPATMAPSQRPPSRQVALRGELSLASPAWEDEGMSPRLHSLSFPSSARTLLETTTARLSSSMDSESLQDLVMNARPLSRYARKELHRQGSAKTLARISTAPSTLRGYQSLDGTTTPPRCSTPLMNSRSTSDSSRQAVQTAVINSVEAALPEMELDDGVDDDDDTNFFLTELEAAARAIALEEKDRELEARVYANLGNLALAQLNFGHALSCHHRDLHLCSSKALDCRLGRARAHRNLSIVYAKLHRRDQQLKHEKEWRAAAHHDGGAYFSLGARMEHC